MTIDTILKNAGFGKRDKEPTIEEVVDVLYYAIVKEITYSNKVLTITFDNIISNTLAFEIAASLRPRWWSLITRFDNGVPDYNVLEMNW